MSKIQPWTTEEEQTLLAMREAQGEEPSWAEIAEALDRPAESCRGKYRHMVLTGDAFGQPEEFEIDEFDEEVARLFEPKFEKKPKKKPSWRELLALAMDNKKAFMATEIGEDEYTVRLKGEPAPIVQYSGDWHLGSRATDYVRWLFEIVLLLKTANTFMICLGDKRENMRSFRHLKAVLSQVLAPQLQAELLVGVLRELVDKKKLLADVGGTHGMYFDEKLAGEMMMKWLYEQEDIAFIENKGVLRIILEFEDGTTKSYPNLLFHKSRYHSFLSTLHANRREYQLTFPGKVVAGAHNHHPGAELYYHYGLMEKLGYDVGGLSWNIKVGPFKDESHQLQDLGSLYHGTTTFCPACVYTKEGIVLLPTLKDALAYRASLKGANQFVEDFIGDMDIDDEDREKLLKSLRMR